MSFLFPAFLFGALAVALPIVLHLLRRDIAPEVPFTAVRLLRRSPIERSRKRRLRDLLLLAARVAALILLALAFARPYLHAATSGAVRIIAVDRSFSMDGPGRFAHALDLARRAIDDTSGSEKVAVLAFDDRAVVLAPPGSAADARTALAGLQPGYGATRYAPAIARAVETADGHSARLVVITDLQRSGWEDEERAPVPATLRVDVRDVGEPPPNLAIAGVRVEPDRIVASIRNDGPSPRTARLRVNRGETTVAEAKFTAAAGAIVDVPVAYRPPESGSLTLSIDDPGGYAADNSRYVVLDPLPRRQVLLVASAGASGSGFYLSRALEAAAGDPADPRGFAVRAITGPSLSGLSSEEAAQYSAVVLLSTRGLDRHGRDVVAQIVRRGGGLLVTGAPDVEPSLVSAMFEWQPPLAADEQAGAVAFSATDLRHPIFRPFGALAANLGQVRFDRRWRLRTSGWDVAARFTDGAPALLERSEGQGRVVVFASDMDRRWNDFPLHPAFVPFAAETVRYAAGGGDQVREYVVAAAPAGAGPKPGVYRLEEDARAVAVNVDARESATARISAADFSAMLDTIAVSPAGEPLAGARQAEAHQGYWRYGLLLMVAALVGESLVGRA